MGETVNGLVPILNQGGGSTPWGRSRTDNRSAQNWPADHAAGSDWRYGSKRLSARARGPKYPLEHAGHVDVYQAAPTSHSGLGGWIWR